MTRLTAMVTVDGKAPSLYTGEYATNEEFWQAFGYDSEIIDAYLEEEEPPKEVRFDWFKDDMWCFGSKYTRKWCPSDMDKGPHYYYAYQIIE